MPSLVHILDLKRIGEVASRSLLPCFSQVDVDAMVWLFSPHRSCRVPYIYLLHSGASGYLPFNTVNISPVKPCRRRRHFSPQMRVNWFVFLNLPILSLGDHLSVTVSPQSPFPTGYVTLPVTTGSPPLRLMPFHSKGQVFFFLPPFNQIAFQQYASPDNPGRGALYVMSAHQT
jgi:hypothetical protein